MGGRASSRYNQGCHTQLPFFECENDIIKQVKNREKLKTREARFGGPYQHPEHQQKRSYPIRPHNQATAIYANIQLYNALASHSQYHLCSTGMSEPLDYELTNQSQIHGQGQIGSIRQPRGQWRAHLGTDSVGLQCRLRHICEVDTIRFQGRDVNMVEITCFGGGVELGTQNRVVGAGEREGELSIQVRVGKGSRLDEVKVEVFGERRGRLQINRLEICGKVVGKREVKSKKAVFESREKTPANRKKTPQYTEQLKQKIQHEHLPKVQAPSSEHPPSFAASDLLPPQQLQIQPNYSTIDAPITILSTLSHVTPAWLSHQRRMQCHFGVPVQHRLSAKLNPRCLLNTRVCLANIYGQQKVRYMGIVRELGGLLREEPEAGCLVATNNPRGNLLSIARLMADVRIVRLGYLDECHRVRTKVALGGYEFTPLELIGY